MSEYLACLLARLRTVCRGGLLRSVGGSVERGGLGGAGRRQAPPAGQADHVRNEYTTAYTLEYIVTLLMLPAHIYIGLCNGTEFRTANAAQMYIAPCLL